MEKKFTVRTLQEMKRRGEKAVMLTAFDAATARWAQEAGVHMLLVGDSMGNTVQHDPRHPGGVNLPHGRGAPRQ